MIQFRRKTEATSKAILTVLGEVKAKELIVLKMTPKNLELSLKGLTAKEIKGLKEQGFEVVKVGKKQKLWYQIH